MLWWSARICVASALSLSRRPGDVSEQAMWFSCRPFLGSSNGPEQDTWLFDGRYNLRRCRWPYRHETAHHPVIAGV